MSMTNNVDKITDFESYMVGIRRGYTNALLKVNKVVKQTISVGEPQRPRHAFIIEATEWEKMVAELREKSTHGNKEAVRSTLVPEGEKGDG